MMRHRCSSTLTTLVAGIALSVLVCACGGGSATSTSTAAKQSTALAYSHCMHSHGVPNFPDPDSSGQILKEQVAAADPGSPQFKAAGTACARLDPYGPPDQSAAQDQAHTAALLAFARCIRSHGFPTFPDPTSGGRLTHEMVAGAGINLHQPRVLQAGDACAGVTHGVITKAIVARFVAGQ